MQVLDHPDRLWLFQYHTTTHLAQETAADITKKAQALLPPKIGGCWSPDYWNGA